MVVFMEVNSISTSEAEEMSSEVQESTALLREGFASEFMDTTVRTGEVSFRSGERTKFHTHDGIQILYVTEGFGVVGTREDQRTVTEGDMILFSPGEEHWHGTTGDEDSTFSHVYFIVEKTGTSTTVVD